MKQNGSFSRVKVRFENAVTHSQFVDCLIFGRIFDQKVYRKFVSKINGVSI